MDINNLITRLRDIAWDFPPEHSINRAADMLYVLQAENNRLQDELMRREAEIARLNEAREIANEKAREYEKRGINELQEKLKKEAEARKKQADIITEERSQKYEQIKIIDNLKKELEQVKTHLQYYLENEEKGIVYIPKFIIEKILKEREQNE